MKVLLVNGSPRKNGCTNRALEEVASALEKNGVQADIEWIGNKPVRGCIACGKCGGSNGCVFDENGINEFAQKAAEYDGYIFGSPVYYASPNGSLFSFMDRLFYSSPKSQWQHKPAAAVCSARRAGTTATLDAIQKYFTISEMPLTSSSYWNMVHGNSPEQVEQDEEGLAVMCTLGNNMAYMIKCRKAAEDAGIAVPEPEPSAKTNFIR